MYRVAIVVDVVATAAAAFFTFLTVFLLKIPPKIDSIEMKNIVESWKMWEYIIRHSKFVRYTVAPYPILISFLFFFATLLLLMLLLLLLLPLLALVFDSHLFILNLIHPFEHENWAGRSKDRRTCVRVFLCAIFFQLEPNCVLVNEYSNPKL